MRTRVFFVSRMSPVVQSLPVLPHAHTRTQPPTHTATHKTAHGKVNSAVQGFAKRFGAGQWSFFGPGSEKKWYSISEDSPQGEWDKMAEKMMITLAESGHPVLRATSPWSRRVLKSNGGGKLAMHYCADPGNDYNSFSHNYFCKSAQSLR